MLPIMQFSIFLSSIISKSREILMKEMLAFKNAMFIFWGFQKMNTECLGTKKQSDYFRIIQLRSNRLWLITHPLLILGIMKI